MGEGEGGKDGSVGKETGKGGRRAREGGDVRGE